MTLTKKETEDDNVVVCIHCHKRFNEARIIGLTLICPFCHKPSDKLLLK